MDTMQTNGTIDNETSTFYKYVFTDLADPRTNDWYLLSSPIPLAVILASYLYFVKIYGPKYMKDKKPYQLKRVMMIYNLLQIAVNIWIFKVAVYLWKNYNWICEPIDYSNSPDALLIAWGCYIYFLNKVSDLLDTVFFVLRKKDRQITFLHIFHHTLMPFGSWVNAKYLPGGHGTFIGLVNAFVHILLYLYYYLAAFGPEVQKYLWWKKYLTRLQLIQFCLVFIHDVQLLFINCSYPKWTLYMTMPNAVFFYYLFNDFYKKSYTTPEASIQHNNIQNDTSTNAKTK